VWTVLDEQLEGELPVRDGGGSSGVGVEDEYRVSTVTLKRGFYGSNEGKGSAADRAGR
jgi:hypothetical protein